MRQRTAFFGFGGYNYCMDTDPVFSLLLSAGTKQALQVFQGLPQRLKISLVLIPALVLMMACVLSDQFTETTSQPDDSPNAASTAVRTLATAIPQVSAPQATARAVCPGGDCANLCVDRETTFQSYTGKPGSPPKSSSRVGGPDNSTTLTVYQIDGDQIRSPDYLPNIPSAYLAYQTDTAEHVKIWQYFATIIPADLRQRLNYFIIFTDGRNGILASVAQLPDDTGHWVLRVDILDANNPRDLTYTLLHEFGHLLTLNDSQVAPDTAVLTHPDDQQLFQKDAANCPQFFALNGCSQPDSYLNLFFQKFWVKIYPQWAKINNEKDQNNYLNLLGQFYSNNQTQFVSQYAVTSPEEDIAETWAKFIFSRKPSASNIANQKILFFYNFPELVDLRTRIVNGICSFTSQK